MKNDNETIITINKKNIAEMLKNHLGLPITSCDEIVKLFFNGIFELTLLENKLVLQNFGSFNISLKNSRPARNLHSNELIMLPPRKILRFVPTKTLKNIINNHYDK